MSMKVAYKCVYFAMVLWISKLTDWVFGALLTKGKILANISKSKVGDSPLIEEVLAFKKALHLALLRGWQKVSLFSDWKVVIFIFGWKVVIDLLSQHWRTNIFFLKKKIMLPPWRSK